MKKELFKACGQCHVCKAEFQMIEIIGKLAICEDCLEKIIHLIDRWRTW